MKDQTPLIQMMIGLAIIYLIGGLSALILGIRNSPCQKAWIDISGLRTEPNHPEWLLE